MSSNMNRILRLAAVASIVTFALGGHVVAQNPPAHGMVWSKAAPFPEPDEELYGSVVNGKMYVVGGFAQIPNPSGAAGRVPPGFIYEYDPGPDKWTKKKSLPVGVHHQAQAVYNGKLYIFGGCAQGISGVGGVTNTWEFDPVADSYRALAALPVKRCAANAEEVGGKIYVIGGMEPFENGDGTRVTGRNEMYDPATNTWTARSPMPTSRNHAYAGVVNGKIYVIGGRIGSGMIGGPNMTGATDIDIVEEYDPATNLWSTLKQRMPTPRSGGGAATYDGKIYVSGGEYQSRQMLAAFRALERYDPVNDTWEILPSMPSARHGDAAGFIGNKLHLVSGKMESGGAPDMAGTLHPWATAAHDVLDIPSGH